MSRADLHRAFAAVASRGVPTHPAFCSCRLCRWERSLCVSLVTEPLAGLRVLAGQARRVGRAFVIARSP